MAMEDEGFSISHLSLCAAALGWHTADRLHHFTPRGAKGSVTICKKHSTIKTSPAVAEGVAGHVWTLEEVVLMIGRHFAAKIEAQFEAAFSVANVTEQRVFTKTYTPILGVGFASLWYFEVWKLSYFSTQSFIEICSNVSLVSPQAEIVPFTVTKLSALIFFTVSIAAN